ncbi:hypothetical protein C8R45DRAFT_1097454 [Mycena sanguinolenta]|nr:hypothetical protein C8R45DRAFT_1097454 [Mycena sanguinolenta]
MAEALVHYRLRNLGAGLEPTDCLGCSIAHWEYFDLEKVGGIDGMIDEIERVLRDLGVQVVRVILDGLQ